MEGFEVTPIKPQLQVLFHVRVVALRLLDNVLKHTDESLVSKIAKYKP